MKWKPLQGSLRPDNPFGNKFRLLMGLFVVLFSIFLLPIQTFLLPDRPRRRDLLPRHPARLRHQGRSGHRAVLIR